MTLPPAPTRHRALFLSDLHLGSPGCRTEALAAFLERHTADTIFLVGDVLDLWHPLARRWGSGEARVLALLQARAAEGARLVYLIGNHDAAMRAPGEAARLPADYAEEAVHLAGDGTRHLVVHGDLCDARWLRSHLVTRAGTAAEGALRVAGGALRGLLRRPLPPEGRGLVSLLLTSVTWALGLGRGHERRLVALAAERGLDGVICGHFHVAGVNRDHGLRYANCGDWVDSLTALAEGWDGSLDLIEARPKAARAAAARPAAAGLPAGLSART